MPKLTQVRSLLFIVGLTTLAIAVLLLTQVTKGNAVVSVDNRAQTADALKISMMATADMPNQDVLTPGPNKIDLFTPAPETHVPINTPGPSPTPHWPDPHQIAGAGMLVEVGNYPSSDYKIENTWYADLSGNRYVVVYAGREVYKPELQRGDPNQGVLIVEVRQKQEQGNSKLLSHNIYMTPSKVGAVHMIGATGMKLILAPVQATIAPDTTFVFDVQTRSFEQ